MPARLRDLARVLAEYGVQVKEPKRGSHWKAVGPDGKTYPVPAGNGLKTEIGDEYIRGACRAFGIDVDDLKNKL